MQRWLILCMVFLYFIQAKAQVVTVLDQESGDPIFNVAIFNREKTLSVLTDFDGKADLTHFDEYEVLFFSHVSHLPYHASLKKIVAQGRQVFLSPKEHLLDEVVISASKFAQKTDKVAQKHISLSQKEVVLRSPQTAADLLKGTGQVFVQKSQLGGGSPMIRGFATNRLLITVDGVRMNTAIFRGGNLQNVISIDPLSIGKTEVIFGPSSVIYGSDAIGGVMNFYSLDPDYSATEKGELRGRVYSRFSTANTETTGHVDLSYGEKKWALLSSFTYSSFGDLKMGSHGPDSYLRHVYVEQQNGQDVIVENKDPQIQIPTGYQQLNFLQKLQFQPAPDWNIDLGLIYSTTSDFPRYDRLYRKRGDRLRSAEWFYGPQEWLQGRLTTEKAGNGEIYDQAKLTLAYQNFQESRNDRDFGESILFQTEEKVDAWSFNLDFVKSFREDKLNYGLELIYNKVHSDGTQKNITTGSTQPGASRYPDNSSWASVAAYTSYSWEISQDLVLQAGSRYNYFDLNATFDREDYDFPFEEANLNSGALTGSLGLVWHQTSFLNWNFSAGTAFRSPNIDDIGKIFDSAPGMVVVPNPDLKPETAYNVEGGMELDLKELIRASFTAYYTYLDDALVRRDYVLDGQTEMLYRGEMSRIQAIQNAAEAKVYGLEAVAKVKLPRDWRFISMLSWTEGIEEQDDGTTAALRHAAPLFGEVHLQWERKKIFLDLFAEYNGKIEHKDLAPSEKDKAYLYALNAAGEPYSPSWYTFNVTGQYRLSSQFFLTLSLENITDQRYRTYSSGIAAPGRNFIVSASYQF